MEKTLNEKELEEEIRKISEEIREISKQIPHTPSGLALSSLIKEKRQLQAKLNKLKEGKEQNFDHFSE